MPVRSSSSAGCSRLYRVVLEQPLPGSSDRHVAIPVLLRELPRLAALPDTHNHVQTCITGDSIDAHNIHYTAWRYTSLPMPVLGRYDNSIAVLKQTLYG
jgi:hypothetical protein